MITTTTSIKDAIALACSTTIPNTKERNKALRGIKWVLQTSKGLFGAVNQENAECFLTDYVEKAQVFTGLDNEELKARFWSAQLGVECVPTLLA